MVSKVRRDLGIEDKDSSKSYDEGGVDKEDGGQLSKYCKVEKRDLHTQMQRANVNAKLESYEDLEARMEHTESLVKGHFDEDCDRAMTKSEWRKTQPRKRQMHESSSDLKRKRRMSS